MRLDPASPHRVANPFDFYEQVRSAGRCIRDDSSGSWLVAGYSDAVAILRDNRLFSSQLMSNSVFGPWYDGAATMLGSDVPDHQRLRSVLQPVFTARHMSGWAAELQRIGRDLLMSSGLVEKIRDGANADFMGAFAEMFPVRVVCRLVGIVDVDECAWIAGLTRRMAQGSAAAMVDPTSPAYTDAVGAGRELADHVRQTVTAQRKRPSKQECVTGRLLDAESAGRISPGEVCATVVLLLLAGTDTAAGAIGNSILLLSEHPMARRKVATDASLMGSAIEEILRFSGPTQFDPRMAVDNVVIGDARVERGDTVLVLQGAANRDPAQFDRPSCFDIVRAPNPHLSFGSGPHLCLGAALARLQMRTAIALILEWIPEHVVEAVTYGDSLFVRGPASLLIARGTGTGGPPRSHKPQDGSASAGRLVSDAVEHDPDGYEVTRDNDRRTPNLAVASEVRELAAVKVESVARADSGTQR